MSHELDLCGEYVDGEIQLRCKGVESQQEIDWAKRAAIVAELKAEIDGAIEDAKSWANRATAAENENMDLKEKVRRLELELERSIDNIVSLGQKASKERLQYLSNNDKIDKIRRIIMEG